MVLRSGVQGEAPGGVHEPETRVRIPPPQPSPKQSRRMSLIEAIANVAVGFGVAVTTQVLVFPVFGLEASLSENLAIGCIFTRSYALRRLLEAMRMIAGPL
jgi:hypothetical protein